MDVFTLPDISKTYLQISKLKECQKDLRNKVFKMSLTTRPLLNVSLYNDIKPTTRHVGVTTYHTPATSSLPGSAKHSETQYVHPPTGSSEITRFH